jgi:hypothetical protein
MTRKEATDYIIEILTKSGYTDDSRIDEDFIGFLIDKKREKIIRDSYSRNASIDPSWLQDLGMVNVTEVSYNDDKTLPICDCTFGKVTLPTTVSLRSGYANKENTGINAILSVCGSTEFYPKPFSRLFQLINLRNNHPEKMYKYYSRIGQAVYTYPYVPVIRPIVILSNPLEGFVISSENIPSGSLIISQSYTVYINQIVHNSIAYNVGDIFTAVNNSYTTIIDGTVQYTNQKRQMTNTDEYPFPGIYMEELLIKILTTEYKLESQVISDVTNNSKDASQLTQIVE